MTRIYVDTSIILRYCQWRYLGGQVVSRDLLDFLGQGLKGEFEIVISQLSISELTSLINHSISQRMLNLITVQIENSPDLSYVGLDSVSESFFNEINKYSKLGLSPMDAMHIRIAQDVGCNYFATQDAKILRLSKELESKGILETGFKILSMKEILKVLDSQRRGDEGQILSGKAFEEFVEEYFENMGYNILVSPSKQDVDIDFIVEKEGKKFAVDTKLYLNSPVSDVDIKRFLVNKPINIDGFWIVSPSGFSKDAEKIAEEKPNKVKLLDTKDPIKDSYPKFKKSLQPYLAPFYEPKIQLEINSTELRKLWNKVKSSGTNKEKKDTLESFAEFLFTSIEGIDIIDKNVRASAEEIDLILANESEKPFWRQLNSPLLVECKNWSKKIGTDEVKKFKDTLESHNIKGGILIATKGITGTKRKDAFLKIREYNQRGFQIIVLTEKISMAFAAEKIQPTN